MAKVKQDDPRRDSGAHDALLAEDRFLLSVQSTIQKLLNDRGIRYRDLAKRMGVSEARVSQMFGDTATNLTIRSIAKILHLLGDAPVLLSKEQLRRQLAEARGAGGAAQARWSVDAGDHRYLAVEQSAELIDAAESVKDAPQPKPTDRDWALAEVAADQRRVA